MAVGTEWSAAMPLPERKREVNSLMEKQKLFSVSYNTVEMKTVEDSKKSCMKLEIITNRC